MPRSLPQKEGILVPAIDRYVTEILPPRDRVLTEMERLAARENIPIIGPACMRLLSLMVLVSGAKRIFEMGSAIGYSAVWLARAAGRGAKIYYTDSDPRNLVRAKEFLRRAGVAGRVEMLLGDALVSFRRTPGVFDMIFIDVDKHQYPAALRLALPRLRHGGLLAVDNVLWSGRVAYKAKAGDRDTRTIQQFNRRLYANKELFPVIVPLRDGVVICRKR